MLSQHRTKTQRSVLDDLSFDDLICSDQNIGRDRQADLLRRLEIDDELELHRLLDRKIGGLAAFEYLVDIRSGAPVQITKAHAVAHKSPVFDKFWRVVYRREAVLYRKFCNLCAARKEERATQHENCFGAPLGCGSESGLNILGI